MATLTVKFDSSKLVAALVRAPEAVNRQMQLGLSKAAQSVADHARQNHRYISRSGNLDRSIGVTVQGQTATISPDLGIAPYAIFQLAGTKTHFIKPVSAKALRWVGESGNFVFDKGHEVKGIVADPFIAAALQAQKDTVISTLRDAMNNGIKAAGLK